mgnify:CR=1 FL=1
MAEAQGDERMHQIEAELNQLHDTLERMGKNSKTTTDIFGRRFQVPIDNEHKATQDPLAVTLCNFSNPHMRGKPLKCLNGFRGRKG